jgi:hypothetical protein
MTCPDCRGSGTITLFVTSKPCAKCGGTGNVVRDDSDLAGLVADAMPKHYEVVATGDNKVEYVAGWPSFHPPTSDAVTFDVTDATALAELWRAVKERAEIAGRWPDPPKQK